MNDTIMGWLNAVVGIVIVVAGTALCLRRDIVRQMAEKKYREAAAALYAQLAGPLEISFGLGLVVEGLAVAGVLPQAMTLPGLLIVGAVLLFVGGFWTFYLRKNRRE